MCGSLAWRELALKGAVLCRSIKCVLLLKASISEVREEGAKRMYGRLEVLGRMLLVLYHGYYGEM